jgi:cytochrome o ubiquinol oxidase subunit IV
MHSEPTAPMPGHATLKSYLVGFFLALALTALPFAMVMQHGFSREVVIAAIFLMALVQILVHVHFFLHLDTSTEQRWNLITFVFAALIVAILVGGSVWIMINIARHMMLT